jgi:hypothetical protein
MYPTWSGGVIHHKCTGCAPVICLGDCSVSLLTSRVPYLSLHLSTIDLQSFNLLDTPFLLIFIVRSVFFFCYDTTSVVVFDVDAKTKYRVLWK